MASDGRLVLIKEPYTFMTFSICDEYLPYSKKDIFDYLPHDPNGKVCFVETFISRGWDRNVLRNLEQAIIARYPQVEKAVWFRPVKDGERKYIYQRRLYAQTV